MKTDETPLSDEARAALLQTEFAAKDLRLGGFTFRPWTASDLITAIELGLKITDPKAMIALGNAEKMREFAKLAFLISLSADDAEAQVADPAGFEKGAKDFLRKLDPLDFTLLVKWLSDRLAGANAAAVDVEPKPPIAGAATEPDCPKKN